MAKRLIDDLSQYDDDITINVRGDDIPLWRFMESFLWIIPKSGGKAIPFRLNFAQRYVYAQLCEMKRAGRPMRMIILKARQLGMSTLIEAIGFCLSMFTPNYRMVVMADEAEHSGTIFQMCKNYYDMLNHSIENEEEIIEYPGTHKGARHPGDLRPELRNDNGKVMYTEEGHSRIKVLVAGDSTGRGSTNDFIHSSETAFQKNLMLVNSSLNASVEPTNPLSFIFMESTANGFNEFKAMWDKAVGGYADFRSSFMPVFFAWYENPEYTKPVPRTGLPVMEDWIYERLKRHPEVTDGQVFWYWTRYLDGYTPELMLQEYPWEPKDAFISSGQNVFDTEKLSRRKDEIMSLPKRYGTFSCSVKYSTDGRSVEVGDVAFEEGHSGSWRVYESPDPRKRYVCVCDPNKGMGADDSAIQVLEQDTGTQVAVYNCKGDLLDKVSEQLYCAGCWYNWALVSFENNTGPNVGEWLLKAGYPLIYQTQKLITQDIGQSVARSLGHSTNRTTRTKMVADFQMAFRADPTIIRDYETACEMETFAIIDGKAQAGSQSDHDDLVTAYMAFWTVRVQQQFGEIEGVPEQDRVPQDVNGLNRYLMMKRREEDMGKVGNTLGIDFG